MKRALCLLTLWLATIACMAKGSQDFASKFMEQCKADSTVSCITVSPKMLEQLVKQAEDYTDNVDVNIRQAISKLKSMRVVTAPADYFEKAENLLKRNPQRFAKQEDYDNGLKRGVIYSRKNRQGNTVELILLHENTQAKTLTVVNITGTIDEEFLCFLYNIKSF
jgi:hypothetical protein